MSFPKYPEYKDSGVEWLGEVPAHWEVKPLKHVATYNDDVLAESTPDNFEIKYVEISDVDEHRGVVGWSVHTFASAPSRARRVLRHGDVLISTVRTYLRAIAPVIQPPANLIGSTGFAVIRPGSTELRSGLLGYALRAEGFISEVISRSVGVSYPAINASDLVSIGVPVPPLAEQLEITSFLGHQTAKIDKLIEEQRRLIELLKEKRQAVISHAVTKGLDPNVPMKDSGVEWLGEVPAHWTVAALRWYATIQGGLAKGKKYGLDEPVVSRPYLRVANVQDGHFNLSVVHDVAVGLSEVSRYELREGDVLMNEGGDSDKLGRGAVWQGAIEGCLHQNHVFAIRPNRHLSATWLSMFTRSDSARSYFYLYSKQSTNLASISSRNVMACPVPIPPIKEQREILGRLSDALVQIDGLMDETEGAMALLQERRSALISAAVTGKIDVCGWSAGAEAEESELAMVAEESAGYSAQGGAA